MPRIPEGNFRTDPSTRVEQEARVRIDAGPTQRARQLGMTPRQVREAGIIDFLRSEKGFRAATGR